MFFTYDSYRDYLRHLKLHGPVLPFCQWDETSPAIILRHDVDLDVAAAHRLAQIEAACGVVSTYFFLTTCHTYNPASAANRALLREMSELGHEIGLHFDPTVYGDVNENELREHVDREAELLQSFLGQDVESISLHNPSIHGQYPLFDGYRNAYDQRIFSADSYLSDSRMDFRGKDPYAFAESVRERPIQILLHPFHFSETGMEYPDLFYASVKDHVREIDRMFRVNSTYERLMTSTDLFSYVTAKEQNE